MLDGKSLEFYCMRFMARFGRQCLKVPPLQVHLPQAWSLSPGLGKEKEENFGVF